MRARTLLSVTGFLAIAPSATAPASASFGFCMEPRAPSALFVTKPTKPLCMNGCSEFEVNEYKQEVTTYFEQLRQYANDVDTYYKRAGEYIQCMSSLD